MKALNYKAEYAKLLTPEIVGYLTQIHEFKGRQDLFFQARKDALSNLLEIAKIQSVEASNRIEGVVTTEDRLKKLVMNKTTPKGRSEREIAGYRDALTTIHENYDYIPVRTGTILQLHRDLYKFSAQSFGGHFKNVENVIADVAPDETKRVRSQHVSALETPDAMEALCGALQEALNDAEIDPLVAIPMFILDFLCVHPFNDGNGRTSRLLTLLLLYRAGYVVGKYVSLEKLIADAKETYYEALWESSVGWHEGENDYLPFVRFSLGVLIAAYREFASRVEVLTLSGASKPDRVRRVIQETVGKITKSQIMKQCPDVSQKTIERTLKELLDSGEIVKTSGGRYASYTWNPEKEKK